MPHKICPVWSETNAKMVADSLAEKPRDYIDLPDPERFRNNVCCCICRHHCKLSSHPWVNGQSGHLGWVCIIKAEDINHAMLCNEHFVGGCEMYEYDDRGDGK